MQEFLRQTGWTQRRLGTELACSQAAVNAILTNRRQQALDFYARVAGVFGQSLGELFNELDYRVRVKTVRTVMFQQSLGDDHRLDTSGVPFHAPPPRSNWADEEFKRVFVSHSHAND